MFPTINKDLLPMKGHYLFFNGATAPVIPFLPVIARQMGFASTTVGIIYTVLPIVGLLAKPIMGGIADRFKCKKTLFVLFQILTAVTLLGINFVPDLPKESKVHLACDYGETAFDVKFTDKCVAHKLTEGTADQPNLECKMSCDLTESQKNTVCKFWYEYQNCSEMPPDIGEFTAIVPADRIEILGDSLYFKVNKVSLPNKSIKKPICPDKQYHISATCDLNCDSSTVNTLISKPLLDDHEVYSVHQFWLFFLLVLFAWSSMAVVVSISDAICFEMLGDKPNLYGYQRLWGSVGWGLFSILTGLMVDAYSGNDTRKDYSSGFYLMLGLMALDVLISSRLRYSQQRIATNFFHDIGKLLIRPNIVVFLVWCMFVGACTSATWNFLFWHLDDVAHKFDSSGGGCNLNSWLKTLEGLVMGVQCLGGELPFFFLSSYILKKLGHVHCMSLVLVGIGLRCVLYSVLVNPWWVLPVELLNGVAFGLLYATMTSYASIAAPPGTEATIQGVVGAIFEGGGVAIGSLIAGILYGKYGGSLMYRIFGIASFIFCVLFVLVQMLWLKRIKSKDISEDSTRYAQPQEALRFMNDDSQEVTLVDHI